VFHVEVLKFHGTLPTSPGQLLPITHGRACVVPDKVTKSRLARGQRQTLITWKGHDVASSSWVDAEELQSMYPTFELILQGGKDVMWGRIYSRRAPTRSRERQGRQLNLVKEPSCQKTESVSKSFLANKIEVSQ
jgi:hypothetical protein